MVGGGPDEPELDTADVRGVAWMSTEQDGRRERTFEVGGRPDAATVGTDPVRSSGRGGEGAEGTESGSEGVTDGAGAGVPTEKATEVVDDVPDDPTEKAADVVDDVPEVIPDPGPDTMPDDTPDAKLKAASDASEEMLDAAPDALDGVPPTGFEFGGERGSMPTDAIDAIESDCLIGLSSAVTLDRLLESPFWAFPSGRFSFSASPPGERAIRAAFLLFIFWLCRRTYPFRAAALSRARWLSAIFFAAACIASRGTRAVGIFVGVVCVAPERRRAGIDVRGVKAGADAFRPR